MQKALKDKLIAIRKSCSRLRTRNGRPWRAYIDRAAAASSIESWEEIAGWSNRQHRLAGVAT